LLIHNSWHIKGKYRQTQKQIAKPTFEGAPDCSGTLHGTGRLLAEEGRPGAVSRWLPAISFSS